MRNVHSAAFAQRGQHFPVSPVMRDPAPPGSMMWPFSEPPARRAGCTNGSDAGTRTSVSPRREGLGGKITLEHHSSNPSARCACCFSFQPSGHRVRGVPIVEQHVRLRPEDVRISALAESHERGEFREVAIHRPSPSRRRRARRPGRFRVVSSTARSVSTSDSPNALIDVYGARCM